MTAENASVPVGSAASAAVPDTSELDLWSAELLLLPSGDQRVRAAQFAIRTAVRAQTVAATKGTDPVDELLDARARASGAKARRVYQSAIGYLRADRILGATRY